VNLLTKTLFLKEVRRIATLPDAEALEEIESLLKLLKSDEASLSNDNENEAEDEQFEKQQALNEITDFEDDIASAKRELTEPITSDYTAENLRDAADRLGDDWDSKELKVEFSDKISRLKTSAEEIADELDRSYLLYCLDIILESDVRSQIGAYDLMERLDHISKKFKLAEILAPEVVQKIRHGKERAAWFRARRKLDDADIAEAADKKAKASNMRNEARAMLKQDWKHAFKDEPAPAI
jgi:hypothetical protein